MWRSLVLAFVATTATAETYSIQLEGHLPVDAPADVFAIDLYDSSAAEIARYQAQGAVVVCYFSAGSFEDWRIDAAGFPSTVVGLAMEGWPGEYWLDVRATDVLMPIMEKRIILAKEKGCDAVDPDNMDVHTQASGFPISPDNQIHYARMLADVAHANGLRIGLKNDLGQIAALVDDFDFATNESCLDYQECEALFPFVAQGKPVYVIDYSGDFDDACQRGGRFPFAFTVGTLDLAAPAVPCR